MRLEFMDNVKENDVLGKNIYTNEGAILLRVGIKLNSIFIQRLKEIGVSYVYIEDDRFEDVVTHDEKLVELKSLTMKNMSQITKNICNNDKTSIRQSVKVLEELIDYIVETGDVNNCLFDIKTYDNYTYLHCIDTCVMSTFLGLNMNFNSSELRELGTGAILHDIGKTKVPYSIINKEGALTDAEYRIIRKHPIYGKEILEKNYTISDNTIKVVSEHHERFDGKGYPYGLSGNSISKFGRVACVCDVYAAVASNRSYRKRFKPNDAYELILAGSGSMFDSNIVNKFKNTFSVYPLGSHVILSNKVEGYVVRQNSGFPDRPIIRVLNAMSIERSERFYEIDLIYNVNITIEDVV
ncbi:HD-GYP domain-containing protein [Clostridium akagii]|uniref:HD-GYP domain-containing protein n=1 Tax=Clostridium akagii TaxID=91623 RepID=UPI0004794551|nr:HD-GYP domain-containing protein [Clostridium akagii]